MPLKQKEFLTYSSILGPLGRGGFPLCVACCGDRMCFVFIWTNANMAPGGRRQPLCSAVVSTFAVLAVFRKSVMLIRACAHARDVRIFNCEAPTLQVSLGRALRLPIRRGWPMTWRTASWSMCVLMQWRNSWYCGTTDSRGATIVVRMSDARSERGIRVP
jgi:hypothetical protein